MQVLIALCRLGFKFQLINDWYLDACRRSTIRYINNQWCQDGLDWLKKTCHKLLSKSTSPGKTAVRGRDLRYRSDDAKFVSRHMLKFRVRRHSGQFFNGFIPQCRSCFLYWRSKLHYLPDSKNIFIHLISSQSSMIYSLPLSLCWLISFLLTLIFVFAIFHWSIFCNSSSWLKYLLLA